ncbi:hypothetical protein GCM10010873_07320 [Cypionkella aquatica]|uniref:Uncharacterized protein n=1 Tax=Cypionkella aquatica TaxID=1756042 RepID=A0AA37WZ07_9RHOB|nr:hypothetical protein [Cypionkella aquatica]GLS85758.1 hypothetical protein GCM10010873_07320 [Cypionkella aquatica]
MHNRLRWLMGATALLYIGPLLAGLGGYGWPLVPVFVVLFVLWQFILRPHQWPRTFHEWTQYQAWATLGSNAAIQTLFVALLFGVGRGIGGALGFIPPYPEMLPVAISFLSIPLARMIWNPWQAIEMNNFLDDAIRKISHPETSTGGAGLETARRMIAPLADLPDETDPGVIAQHLVALSAHAHPDHIRSALFERMRDANPSRAETIALILHATDGRLAEIVPGDGPTMVLRLLPEDPGLIALFATRLTAALQQDADLWGKSPSVDYLTELAARFDNSEAEAPLRDLINATNAAEPEDGLA